MTELKSLRDMVDEHDAPAILRELELIEKQLESTISLKTQRTDLSEEQVRRCPQPEARVEIGRLLYLCEQISQQLSRNSLPARVTINTSALLALVFQGGMVAKVLNPDHDDKDCAGFADHGCHSAECPEACPETEGCPEAETDCDGCDSAGCEDFLGEVVSKVITPLFQRATEEALTIMAEKSSTPKVDAEIPNAEYRTDVMKLVIASNALKHIANPIDQMTALVPVMQLDMLQDLARKVAGKAPDAQSCKRWI